MAPHFPGAHFLSSFPSCFPQITHLLPNRYLLTSLTLFFWFDLSPQLLVSPSQLEMKCHWKLVNTQKGTACSPNSVVGAGNTQLPAPSCLRTLQASGNEMDHFSPSQTTFPVSKARCVLD